MLRIKYRAAIGILFLASCNRYQSVERRVVVPCPAAPAQVPLRLVASSPPGGTLRGQVVSTFDNAGVTGAFVRLMRTEEMARAETDAAGRFAIDSLPPGLYEVQTRRVGFKVRRDSLEWSVGEPQSVVIPLDLTTE